MSRAIYNTLDIVTSLLQLRGSRGCESRLRDGRPALLSLGRTRHPSRQGPEGRRALEMRGARGERGEHSARRILGAPACSKMEFRWRDGAILGASFSWLFHRYIQVVLSASLGFQNGEGKRAGYIDTTRAVSGICGASVGLLTLA